MNIFMNLLKILLFGIGSLVFIICLRLIGELIGYDYGWNELNFNNLTHGDNFRDGFILIYIVIAICLYLFVIGQLLKQRIWVQISCFLLLIFSIYNFFELATEKQIQMYLERHEGSMGYTTWIEHSIPLDKFCLNATIILLLTYLFRSVCTYINNQQPQKILLDEVK